MVLSGGCCVVEEEEEGEGGEVGWSNVSRHKLIRTVILLFSNPRHVDTPAALWPSPNPHSPSSSSTYPFLFGFFGWLLYAGGPLRLPLTVLCC